MVFLYAPCWLITRRYLGPTQLDASSQALWSIKSRYQLGLGRSAIPIRHIFPPLLAMIMLCVLNVHQARSADHLTLSVERHRSREFSHATWNACQRPTTTTHYTINSNAP